MAITIESQNGVGHDRLYPARMRIVSYLSPGFPASLFETLAALLDAELTLISDMSGPPPGEDPFADGTFDLGWICSTSFVDLSLRSQEPSVKLTGVGWTPLDPDISGDPVYFGDLVVPARSTAQSLHDLGGAVIGCNDPVSLSGHYALRFALHDLGVEADTFAQLRFTGGHHQSLDLLLEGRLDAAVVDSVVLSARRRDPAVVDSLRTIQRLGPWPVQPLVARSSLPDSQVLAVRTALLDANRLPAVQTELANAMLASLVPTGPDHYGRVRHAMQSLEV